MHISVPTLDTNIINVVCNNKKKSILNYKFKLKIVITVILERANDQKFKSNKRTDNEQTEHKILRLDENKNPEPYECRALNFLVNEYLLEQNYTLSSITFCEENEDQVFLLFGRIC